MIAKKNRDSNIELYRIFLMLIIVAHHYIVSSDIINVVNENPFAGGWYNLVALLFGWGGKTAINGFVLITGWFMCLQEFRWKKFLTLCFEVEFYRIIIYIIFLLTKYEPFSVKDFYKVIFDVPYNFCKGFTSSFIAFYLLIPFINKLINVLDKKKHAQFIFILLILYTMIPTFFFNGMYEYIGWYFTLYIIAAYIRLYPCQIFDNKRLTGVATVIILLLSWTSVIVIYEVGKHFYKVLPWYWFISDSNKVLAFLTAFFSFCFFKNISIGQNRLINKVAASTFGVLLIHASSNTMRKWLWQDVFHNLLHFKNDSLIIFILHAFASTLCVFAVCTAIDMLRKFIQKQVYGAFICLKTKQLQ